MRVDHLIEELKKLPPDSIICAFAGRLEDGDYHPADVLERLEPGVEVPTDFVGWVLRP